MKRTYTYGNRVTHSTESVENGSAVSMVGTASETTDRTDDRDAEAAVEILSKKYRNNNPVEQYRRESRVRICRKRNMPMMNVAFL